MFSLQGTLDITQIKKLSSRDRVPKCHRELLILAYHPKLGHLKWEHSFYLTWSLWVRIMARARLGGSSLRSVTGLQSNGGWCWNSCVAQVVPSEPNRILQFPPPPPQVQKRAVNDEDDRVTDSGSDAHSWVVLQTL